MFLFTFRALYVFCIFFFYLEELILIFSYFDPPTIWQKESKLLQWTFPMKYANYIHACVQTLLVGKRHRVCTKQTHNPVCLTQPLAVYKTARCSLILPTKMLVCTRNVQFTYFMERASSEWPPTYPLI